MRPGGALGEAAQEERGGDGAAAAFAGGVVHVGPGRVDEALVVLDQRHAPVGLLVGLARGEEGLDELLVVAEERGQVGAQGHARGAGEGGQIDQARGAQLARQAQAVGQEQAALGVGVTDLDLEACVGVDHVARAEGVGADGVLGAGDHRDEGRGAARATEGVERADHGASAAHVLAHQEHAARGLDAQAARVEHDALADDADPGRDAAGAVLDHGHGRLVDARAADRVHQVEALVEQLIADPGARLPAVAIGDLARRGGQALGVQVAGGRVDEVAREQHALDARAHARQARLVDRARDQMAVARDAHGGDARTEGVAGEGDAFDRRLGVRGVEGVGQQQGPGRPALELAHGAGQPMAQALAPGALAAADQQQGLAVALGDPERALGLAREARVGGQVGQRGAAAGVQQAAGVARQRLEVLRRDGEHSRALGPGRELYGDADAVAHGARRLTASMGRPPPRLAAWAPERHRSCRQLAVA